MKDAMGIIYTSKDSFALRELTSSRAVAAIPVAARYRIIDFILSSLVNSGVHKVAIITQRNYHSLMDHLGSGKEWDLHTRNNGLFILPPFVTDNNNGSYDGVLEGLSYNMDTLRRSTQEYVILTNSNTILNTSFLPMLRFHESTGADITLLYSKAGKAVNDFGSSANAEHVFVDVAPDGTVTDMEVNPNAASYDNVLHDVLVIKRTLLIHLVNRALSQGMKDMNGELLRSLIATGELRVKGFEFTGLWRRIETIRGYFNFSMDVLDPAIQHELFDAYPIRTKTRDDVPALYEDTSRVTCSLVAHGCVIAGTVENCVLFRGVHIHKGAHLKNCVIMQDSSIGENTELENVILDKAVTIRDGCRLIGDKNYPIVIGKNMTL